MKHPIKFEAIYPKKTSDFATTANLGKFMHFGSRMFENTLDDQAQSTSVGRGPAGSLHSIALPYPNVVSSESSVWDSGDNDGVYGSTDADVRGIVAGMWGRAFQSIGNVFGRNTRVDEIQMELSMAGFKQPTLRQRHYSWNLVNREAGDGVLIAGICRSFQASVYPRMSSGKLGNEHVQPPPMWTVTMMDANKQNAISPAFQPTRDGSNHLIPYPFGESGQPDEDALFVRPGKWRWHMDQFESVLVRAEISPTKATDSTMTIASDGFPLVTTLQLSFMEIAQVVANSEWTHIIPYAYATDSKTPGWRGGGKPFSDL